MIGSLHNGLYEKSVLKNEVKNQRKINNLKELHKSKLNGRRKEPYTQSDAFIVEQNEAPNKEAEEKAKRETYRLASFRKCKIAVPPYNLAMAGFYYVGPGDRVRCYSCGNCIQSWKPKDDVSSERWHARDCRHFFKKGSNNISIGDTSSEASSPAITTTAPITSSTSVQSSTEAKKIAYPAVAPPSYASLPHHGGVSLPLQHRPPPIISGPVEPKPGPSSLQEPVPRFGAVYFPSHQFVLKSLSLHKEVDRRQSFTQQWPPDLLHLVGPLARTGFFYLGNSDRTQCFSCGAVQKNWLANDDVRKVHAEWFGNCRMVRGIDTRNIPISTEGQDVLLSPSQQIGSSPRRSPNYSLSSVPPQSNIPGGYYGPPSPLPSRVQSLEFSDPQIRGPPIYRSSESVENSQISRQFSERSTDTSSTASLLESVFTTPTFSTESGDVTVNLPVSLAEYSDVTSSSSTSVVHTPSHSRPTIRQETPSHSRASIRQEVVSPSHSRYISRQEAPSVRQQTASIREEIPIDLEETTPISYVRRTSPFSLPAPTTTRSIDNYSAASYMPPSTRSSTQPGARTGELPFYSAASTSRGASSTPTLPFQSNFPATASRAAVARGNERIVTSPPADPPLLDLSILSPTTVSSTIPATAGQVSSVTAAAAQPSIASSSSQNWIRELDPLAAVIRPAEPERPELPQSELDVDDDFVEDHKMRFMLQEMYPCQEPTSRDMVYLSQRIASFRQPWPENSSLSQIPDVAKAGFFYLGVSDHVRCWYCGIEAKDWASNKRAWDNHALLYPSCQYLLRNRGLGFVEAVLSQVAQEAENLSSVSGPSSRASSLVRSYPSSPYPSFSGVIESGPERLPTPPIVDPRVEHEQQRLELNEAMQSEMAMLVMGMGFSYNHVRQVVKKQIERFSCSFQTSEAMIDALIMTPEDLIDFNSDEDGSQDDHTIDRQVGILEELPDNLDLYQSGEPSLVSYPEEDRDDITGRGDVISTQSNVGTSANQSREAIRSPEAHSSSRIDQSSSAGEDLQAELFRLRQEKRCKICLDRDACMVFIPCGHMCACMECTHRLKQCPLCRRRIDKAYKTY